MRLHIGWLRGRCELFVYLGLPSTSSCNQLEMDGSINKFSKSFFRRVTTLNASSSIVRLFNLSSIAKFSPSLSAYNSAIMLLVLPRALAYLRIQAPSWFRITLPLPAFLGFPKAEPSEFNFIHPSGGFTHPIGMMVLEFFTFVSIPIEKNYALTWMHLFKIRLSTLLVRNT